MLAGCAFLIGALVVWGLFGTVYVNTNCDGVRVDDQVCCFLSTEETTHIQVGNAATVNNLQMSVTSISDVPLSIAEVEEIVESDYLTSTLVGDEEWLFEVVIEGDGVEDLATGVPLTVSITADQVTPFELAFGSED